MLKPVIAINFQNKENLWDDKFSFICGETSVYYIIYHGEYFFYLVIKGD